MPQQLGAHCFVAPVRIVFRTLLFLDGNLVHFRDRFSHQHGELHEGAVVVFSVLTRLKIDWQGNGVLTFLRSRDCGKRWI